MLDRGHYKRQGLPSGFPNTWLQDLFRVRFDDAGEVTRQASLRRRSAVWSAHRGSSSHGRCFDFSRFFDIAEQYCEHNYYLEVAAIYQGSRGSIAIFISSTSPMTTIPRRFSLCLRAMVISSRSKADTSGLDPEAVDICRREMT